MRVGAQPRVHESHEEAIKEKALLVCPAAALAGVFSHWKCQLLRFLSLLVLPGIRDGKGQVLVVFVLFVFFFKKKITMLTFMMAAHFYSA